MNKDIEFKWNNKEFTHFYRNSADIIILERQRAIKILLEIIQLHFHSLTGLNVLDLGCGDGIITRYICENFPDNNFHLIDASENMLNKAKENLSNDLNITFSHLTFEDYIDLPSENNRYDLAFSANAIHHLDSIRKMEMFAKIYMELKHGGIFLNIDPVHPSSSYSEKIQFGIWKNWMNETLKNMENKDEIGKYDNIPEIYKNNLENKPSGLWEQLQMLGKCGFRDADCFYKYSIFAVFGGTKQ
jgi:tRNA (cmo5U34)-methyltransferase